MEHRPDEILDDGSVIYYWTVGEMEVSARVFTCGCRYGYMTDDLCAHAEAYYRGLGDGVGCKQFEAMSRADYRNGLSDAVLDVMISGKTLDDVCTKSLWCEMCKETRHHLDLHGDGTVWKCMSCGEYAKVS